jgi:hypothetical protein
MRFCKEVQVLEQVDDELAVDLVEECQEPDHIIPVEDDYEEDENSDDNDKYSDLAVEDEDNILDVDLTDLNDSHDLADQVKKAETLWRSVGNNTKIRFHGSSERTYYRKKLKTDQLIQSASTTKDIRSFMQ